MGVGIIFGAVALGAVLFWLVLARRSRRLQPPGSEGRRAENARLAKIAALMLVGLGVGFFLIFAIAEMSGGEGSGIQHVAPAVLLAALLWLGWKRPRTAGLVVLFAFAVPLTVAFVVGVATDDVRTGEQWVAVLLPLVPLLTASLFLWAGRGERSRH